MPQTVGKRRRAHRDKPHHSNIVRHARFVEGVKQGETLRALCQRLHINKNTATKWLRGVRMEIAKALDAHGLDEHLIAERTKKLLDGKKPNRVHLDCLQFVAKLRSYFPREDQPAAPPVTLVFSTANLILPGEEPNYHNQGRQLDQAPTVALDNPAVAADDGATE